VNLRACYREVAPDWLRDNVRLHKRHAISAYVWLRTRRPRERLKPAFLIVGAGKAGTTSLFAYLICHPQIAEPLRKEIHYFNDDWGRSLSWDRPIDWYLAHFPRADRVSPGTITGEASPGYLFGPETPARVASVLPDVKIIVLLRNPIFRAISHYYHDASRRVGDPGGLAAYLVAEGMELQPELTNRLMSDLGWDKRPINPPSEGARPPIYIRSGFYADQLSNWFRYFDRDQMLILKSEDLFANPRDVYARTLKFLDLGFFDPGSMKAHNVGSYGKVDPVIIRYLSEIYADPNRRLHELLGLDFGWDDPD